MPFIDSVGIVQQANQLLFLGKADVGIGINHNRGNPQNLYPLNNLLSRKIIMVCRASGRKREQHQAEYE